MLTQNLKRLIEITHINNIFSINVADSLVSYNTLLLFQFMPMMVATGVRLHNGVTRSDFNFDTILHT